MRPPVSVLVIALLAGCSTSAGTGEVPTSSSVTTPTKAAAPALKVEEVASGLSHGWDIGFLPDGKVLVTQRPGRIALLSSANPGATVTQIPVESVRAQGEGGLMGMVVHPDFATSREFTTCLAYQEAGKPVDIRLVTWRLGTDEKSIEQVRVLLNGLPLADSGRHSGCRPTLAADGALLVGTGDTANPAVPQNRDSLGGKVLRIDLRTGEALPDNPVPGSRVYTYGHRNVQGVAVRQNGQVLTVEHGPDQNDEVNLLKAGANYGWDPSHGGTVTTYDESVPMTDLTRFPDAVAAKWQSGATTEATCAAAVLSGSQWGAFDGALVVTALKGAKLLVLNLDRDAAVTSVAIPPEIADHYGRLRAARTGPDGALYVTTSNGQDDKLLRITPAA